MRTRCVKKRLDDVNVCLAQIMSPARDRSVKSPDRARRACYENPTYGSQAKSVAQLRSLSRWGLERRQKRMSNRAGVHRLGTTFVAVAAAMTMALFFGGTAQAAPTTFHAHTAADLVTDVQTSSAGDIILLDAGIQYSVAQSLDVNHNLTIKTDPSQLPGGHVAATISGGSISIPSTLDSGEKDIIVAGP